MRQTGVGHVGREAVEEEERRAARDERRREDRMRIATKSGTPELRRDDLTFGRFHITHESTGAFYHVMAGEPSAHKDGFDAWYVERSGDVTFLQRPASGPRSRDELAAYRAAKQQRTAPPRRPKVA